MAVRYSINWMGVANLEWYRTRGLLVKKTITMTSPATRWGKYNPGDTIEVEEPQTYYSCGRIDVTGTDNHWGDEIAVPPMTNQSWQLFGTWLETFETDDMWTLEQLVELYEQANPKIVWDTYTKTKENSL